MVVEREHAQQDANRKLSRRQVQSVHNQQVWGIPVRRTTVKLPNDR
jgi:hypothetical protein